VEKRKVIYSLYYRCFCCTSITRFFGVIKLL